MADFAIYRSMHTVRGGAAKPARTLALSPEEEAAIRELGFEQAQAWALDRLGILLEGLGARLQLLRSDIVQAVCAERGMSSLPESLRPVVEERMVASPRVRGLRIALEAGREAMVHQMTLVYTPTEAE